MKLVAFSLSLLFVTSAFGKEFFLRKLDELERRISALEAKVNGSTPQKSSGLKVKDMGNQKVNTSRGISSGSASTPQLSKEQQEEIRKQLEFIKSRQQESQKILDELMNEE